MESENLITDRRCDVNDSGGDDIDMDMDKKITRATATRIYCSRSGLSLSTSHHSLGCCSSISGVHGDNDFNRLKSEKRRRHSSGCHRVRILRRKGGGGGGGCSSSITTKYIKSLRLQEENTAEDPEDTGLVWRPDIDNENLIGGGCCYTSTSLLGMNSLPEVIGCRQSNFTCKQVRINSIFIANT